MRRAIFVSTALALTLALVYACDQEPAAPVAPPAPAPVVGAPPVPVQEALTGDPTQAVVLSQAWFYKNAAGKLTPAPARLQIWREQNGTWSATRLEDGDSNVFHKAIFYDGGLLTIAGTKAMLKKWVFADGAWKQDTLWEKSWGGKFDRLRDIEIGDVDGDGKDEFVIATHDNGVIAVYNPDEGALATVELGAKPDTFVHEIELGDIDGDGKMEIFATPSDRNQANASQKGELAMFRWDGTTYQHTVVEQFDGTHAKEILVTDLNGDGKDELLAVLEAEIGPDKKIVKPVEIRQYKQGKDGSFTHDSIATIDDKQTRFLLAGDVDGDGKIELVAAAMKSGVWILEQDAKGAWTPTNIDSNSGGFEHASVLADLNGDGQVELYVAADDQRELKRYVFNKETKAWDTTLLGKLEDSTFTWGVAAGKL